jgi:Tfp pilus assembly protein PilO
MKQKGNTISKRDQQLLTILLAVVLIFLAYSFVAGPAYDKGKVLKGDIRSAEETLQTAQDLVQQGPQLKKELALEKAEMQEKYRIFLYDINEPNLLYSLDTLMAASGFAVNSYQQDVSIVGTIDFIASDYVPPQYPLLDMAKELNPDLAQNQGQGTNTTPEDAGEDLAAAVEQMDINIGFSGAGYDAIYRFITAVEGMERSFIVNEISIGKEPETAGLSGQLIVRAISLPKIEEAQKDDMNFEPVVPKGKTNPF